jgi:hypothetical protein
MTTPVDKDARITVKEFKAFFEADGGEKVTIQELKALKEEPSVGGNKNGYDDIAVGLTNGSLTYADLR